MIVHVAGSSKKGRLLVPHIALRDGVGVVARNRSLELAHSIYCRQC
jgi:hypothetical protein